MEDQIFVSMLYNNFFLSGSASVKNLLLYFDFKRGVISHSVFFLGTYREILKGINGR